MDAYADLQSGRLGPLAELSLAQGPVVMVCGVGRTAAIATELLRANGVETLTLDGGMRSWSLAWNSATTTISGCKVIQVRRTGKGCLSYIVESRSEAIVIDASVDPDVYVRLLSERGWRLVAVTDTHIHAHHLSRSRQLAHLEGAALLLPTQNRAQYPFRPVADSDRIVFGSTALVAMRTPGHTDESTTYLLDDTAAFTGDTLFLNSVGRPDLEGGTPPGADVSRASPSHVGQPSPPAARGDSGVPRPRLGGNTVRWPDVGDDGRDHPGYRGARETRGSRVRAGRFGADPSKSAQPLTHRRVQRAR